MSDELLPCPFCKKSGALKLTRASELFADEDEEVPYMHSETYAVICDASSPNGPGGCGGQGGFKDTEQAAIEAWNRRAALSTQPAAPSPVVAVVEHTGREWDHVDDVLAVIERMRSGEWYWGSNSRCKYIELRIDTRDGGCILRDRESVRITPAQLAKQLGDLGRMPPWERAATPPAPASRVPKYDPRMRFLENEKGILDLRIEGLSMRQIKDIFEWEYGELMWSEGCAYPSEKVKLQFIRADLSPVKPAPRSDEAIRATQRAAFYEMRAAAISPKEE
jgi:hypothetical protein